MVIDVKPAARVGKNRGYDGVLLLMIMIPEKLESYVQSVLISPNSLTTLRFLCQLTLI